MRPGRYESFKRKTLCEWREYGRGSTEGLERPPVGGRLAQNSPENRVISPLLPLLEYQIIEVGAFVCKFKSFSGGSE